MQPAADFVYDSAMALDLGRRDRQEDALASDFPSGQPFGFVVLADGMGGHEAGDVASKIVVTEVFSALKLQSGDADQLEPQLAEVLEGAAFNANDCIGHYARENPDSYGMGATLLASVLVENRLYWVSVGDSPLYLFRDGALTRLNENHALASQIEFLVASGLMSREDAMQHPDQSCLTSVLIGGDIVQIDCPRQPFTLNENDILIAASDGLQFISEEQIESLLRFQCRNSAEDISATLAQEIKALDDPCQDNLSLCVVKVQRRSTAARTCAQMAAAMNRAAPQDHCETVTRLRDGKSETVTILTRVQRSRTAAGN